MEACNMDRMGCYDQENSYFFKEKPIPKSEDIIVFDEPKPPVGYYHYSNQACQGALICETASFPRWVKKSEYECHSAYEDRLGQWDYEYYKKASKQIGGPWEYKLPPFSDAKLKKIAKDLLKLKRLPEHVRFIYYFNVSSGYSCPVVIAVVKIKNLKRKINWEDD